LCCAFFLSLFHIRLPRGFHSWAWEEMAREFNRQDNERNVGVLRAVYGRQTFADAHLDPSATCYVADATKLKEEFTSLSTALTTALVNLRLSGNGDGRPMDDATSNTVYQSEFGARYCNGDMAMFYAYTCFVEHQLLESSTCEMPHSAKASSLTSPKCVDPPNMRVDATGTSKITTAEALVKLSEAVSNQRPAADAATSSARLAAELKCAQAQSEGAEIELNRLKETELQKTQADIADLESAGKPVPTWMLKKCEKLTKALEAQWC